MYKGRKPDKTGFTINASYEGERIEEKVDRIMNNNEPITDGVEPIYTDRKDGPLPDYDIRTDRWEHAIDAMDKVAKGRIAQREEKAKGREEVGKPEPQQGTEGDPKDVKS